MAVAAIAAWVLGKRSIAVGVVAGTLAWSAFIVLALLAMGDAMEGFNWRRSAVRAGVLASDYSLAVDTEWVGKTLVMADSVDDRELAGNGRRLAVVAVAVALSVAGIAWLVAGFDPPSFSRTATETADPTADLTACKVAEVGPEIAGPSGGPTNEVGEARKAPVMAAFVSVTNPRDVDTTVRLFVSFGSAADPVDQRETIAARTTQTVVVPARGPARKAAADCALRVTFEP
jgi:hypothetical protein